MGGEAASAPAATCDVEMGPDAQAAGHLLAPVGQLTVPSARSYWRPVARAQLSSSDSCSPGLLVDGRQAEVSASGDTSPVSVSLPWWRQDVCSNDGLIVESDHRVMSSRPVHPMGPCLSGATRLRWSPVVADPSYRAALPVSLLIGGRLSPPCIGALRPSHARCTSISGTFRDRIRGLHESGSLDLPVVDQAAPAAYFEVPLSPMDASPVAGASVTPAVPVSHCSLGEHASPCTPVVPGSPCTPRLPHADPVTGNVALHSVLNQIRAHIANPVLPLPSVQRSRRAKLVVPEDQLRHSARIAFNSRGKPASYIKRAQSVLVSKLGFCGIEDEPDVDCLARYAEMFKEPLPASAIDALIKLFSLEQYQTAGAPTPVC
ncbi:hypothetical protein VPH35_104488 [Triticum aestivum]